MNTNRSLPDLSIKKIWGKLFRHDNDIEVLQERPVNNNILINSNFANPVNQRGVIGDTWNKHTTYGLDRWKLYARGSGLNTNNYTIDTTKHKVSKNDGYITIFTKGGETYTHLAYSHEFPEQLKGKDITLSIKCRCTKDSYFTMNFSDTNVKTFVGTFKGTGNFEVYTLTASIVNGCGGLYFGTGNCNPVTYEYTPLSMNTTLDIEWIKLELGEVATPYVPRLYVEELQLCQRYYQVLPVFNAVLIAMNTNMLRFAIDIPFVMRVQSPTVKTSQVVVRQNLNNVSGFINSLYYVNATSQKQVAIQCDKNSHGLSYASYATLGGIVLLDAEL